MVKTKDKVYGAAENVKPYVERAMNDEKLRQDVMSAFATAKDLYTELIGPRGAVTLATRVATDDDIREKLSAAVDDLRNAAGRLQGLYVSLIASSHVCQHLKRLLNCAPGLFAGQARSYGSARSSSTRARGWWPSAIL